MAARYYLHKRGTRREKRLRLIVYRGGRQIAVMIPVTLRPSDWSQKTQRVKASAPGATELNGELHRLRNEAEALAIRYPDDDELRSALLQRVGRAPQRSAPTLLADFEAFLAFKGSRVKTSTLQVFAALHEHLKAFLNKRPGGLKVTAKGVGSGFVEDFQSFLLGQGLGNNSINKYASRLRTFLVWLEKRGKIDKAPNAKPLKTAKGHVIRLTLDELSALQAVDLSGEQQGYEAARELFLMCVFTGQRIGDVVKMEWKDLQGDKWFLREEKTGVVRRVPLTRPAMKIVEGHQGERRPVPKLSEQKTNQYIKVVAMRAGINTPVTIRSQIGGKVETKTVPKHEAISTHVGRRTFISLMMESGVSAKEMLNITHNDLRSLKHYAGASEEHLRTVMTKVFEASKTSGETTWSTYTKS